MKKFSDFEGVELVAVVLLTVLIYSFLLVVQTVVVYYAWNWLLIELLGLTLKPISLLNALFVAILIDLLKGIFMSK